MFDALNSNIGIPLNREQTTKFGLKFVKCKNGACRSNLPAVEERLRAWNFKAMWNVMHPLINFITHAYDCINYKSFPSYLQLHVPGRAINISVTRVGNDIS